MTTKPIRRALVHTALVVCFAGWMTAAVVAPSAAQDRGNPGWFLRLTPYFWGTNLGGSQTLGFAPESQLVGDFKIPVGDTVLANGWAARLEVGKGRVRGIVGAWSAGIANSAAFTRVDDSTVAINGSYDLRWSELELFASVQIGRFIAARTVELFGGARYVRYEEELAAGSSGDTTVTESWVDPVVGGRIFSEIGGPFWAMFTGDIGGFGVGSEFTWQVGGEVGVRVAKPLDLSLRYNYQEVEYNNGRSGSERFVWNNGVAQGWFLGASLTL